VTDTELELPQGWSNIEFKKAIKNIPLTGKKLKQKEYLQTGKFPVIDQGQDFIGGFTNKNDFLVECEFPVIVFGDHTKAIKFVNQNFVAGADGVKVLQPNSFFVPKLLYYFIQTIPLPNKGYARHYQYLEKSNTKLPPLKEQKRIVSKIEELFSKIDSAKQSLEQIKLKLELYRNSLLESAFEGKLKNKKIKFEVNNWSKVSYCDVSNKITYGFTCPMPDSDEGPWKITALNIRNGKINYENARKTDWESFNTLLTDKSRPKVGTVVIIKDGATIGRVGIIDRENVCISQSVASIEPNNKIISEFLAYSLHRPKAKILIEKNKRATGIPHISITDLAKWEILLPSLKEQEQIVSQIEQGFSLIQNTTQIVESSLQNLQTMRMSVLKNAFEGKLVPQDPNDEPASALLERIKLKN
jgi:type I restriction enzyme, S subunit